MTETATVTLDDGVTTVTRPGTRWRNPTGRVIAIELRVDGPRENPLFDRAVPPGKGNPQYLAPSYLVRHEDGAVARQPIMANGLAPLFVLPPRGEAVVDRELDEVIQKTGCAMYGCLGARCANRSHQRFVLGGLAPQLTRIGPDGTAAPLTLHPALEAQPERPAIVVDADMHERVMRRVNGGAR